MKTFAAIWTISLVWAGLAWAADCRNEVFEDVPFTVCEADPMKDDIEFRQLDPVELDCAPVHLAAYQRQQTHNAHCRQRLS